MTLHSIFAKINYFSNFEKKTTISVSPFYLLSLPSLFYNPHHFFRSNNERLDWKILYVACYKKCFVCLTRIHCNFVKNNIVWISGLLFGCNAGKFNTVVNNRLYQQVFSFWCKFLLELISAKNFGIFCNDFFTVNRNNCFVKNFHKNLYCRRVFVRLYQRRNKNVCVNNCKNFHSLFSLRNGRGSLSLLAIRLDFGINFIKAHILQSVLFCFFSKLRKCFLTLFKRCFFIFINLQIKRNSAFFHGLFQEHADCGRQIKSEPLKNVSRFVFQILGQQVDTMLILESIIFTVSCCK